jgi:hypothetical protein
MNSGFRFVCPNKSRGKQSRIKKMRNQFRFFLKIIPENSNNGIPNKTCQEEHL